MLKEPFDATIFTQLLSRVRTHIRILEDVVDDGTISKEDVHKSLDFIEEAFCEILHRMSVRDIKPEDISEEYAKEYTYLLISRNICMHIDFFSKEVADKLEEVIKNAFPTYFPEITREMYDWYGIPDKEFVSIFKA